LVRYCLSTNLRRKYIFIHIHWWGNGKESSTVRTPQHPLNVKPPAGMTSVARSKWRQIKYTDTVHYDTVLVEKIVSLRTKKVSAADFHKAQRRLEVAKAFQQQVRVWLSCVHIGPYALIQDLLHELRNFHLGSYIDRNWTFSTKISVFFNAVSIKDIWRKSLD
jgi:hypothetical protein